MPHSRSHASGAGHRPRTADAAGPIGKAPLASAFGSRNATLLTGLALAAALFLGGNDATAPLAEAACEMLVGLLFTARFALAPGEDLRAIPGPAWAICGLLLALPALQLLPLPPGLWQALPGREIERDALALIGQAQSWRPLSLTPDRSFAALLGATNGAMVLLMAAALGQRARNRLLLTILLVAGASVLVGSQQLTGAYNNFFRFYLPDQFFLEGFQINHNSEGDLLLIAILALAALIADSHALNTIRGERHRTMALMVAVTAVLAVAVVMTASRMSMLLLAPTLAAALFIMRRWLRLEWRAWIRITGGLLALALAGGVVVAQSAVVQRALQRFNLPADLRPEMWRMTAEAARDLFPLGGGMGSFPNVYQIHEKLEVVNEHYANRADNDYLELLLEAGVPGVLVLVAIVAILVRTVVQTRHGRRGKGLAQHQFALFSLALLAVHSVLDFPLRPLSIAAVAACCVALLLPGRRPGPSITDPAASPATNEDQPRAAPAPIPLRESGLIAGIGAAFVLCAAGSGLDRATLFSPALIDWVPAPFRSTALTMQAAHLYEAQDGRALLPAAGAALARAPMEAANASLLGGAYGLLGRDAEAEQAYAVSARLGWRIPNTQAYWMFRQMELGNGDAAADRWDALLRVNPALHTNLRLMLPVESSISLRPALLRKLAGNPPWLGRYIDEIELLPAEVMSNRAEILLELAENGHPLGCQRIASATYQLAEHDDLEGAKALWDAHCPQARGGIVWNGDFSHSMQNTRGSAFDWIFLTSGDFNVMQLASADHRRQSLSVTSSSPFAQTFIYQHIVVGPGTYEVAWRANDGTTLPDPAIVPLLGCAQQEPVRASAFRQTGSGRWAARLVVPAPCDRPNLQFSILPSRAGVEFGSISMTQLSDQAGLPQQAEPAN